MIIQYQRPPLYAKQRAAIFHDKPYGLIEASTKAGKTDGNIAWILERSLIGSSPNQNRWWVAPVYQQAEIAYTRMKSGLPKGMCEGHDTKLRLTFPNQTHIWFKSGEKPDICKARTSTTSSSTKRAASRKRRSPPSGQC